MGELVVLLVLVTVVLGGVGLYRRHAVNQRQAAEQAALETQLSTSKRAADEDVTKFGEELQRLDSDVAGHALDEPMQQDYQRALDAYDDAKMSLDAVSKPDEIRHVTEILEDGRYAVACVKARIAKQPLPAKRPPCFFNPAHGPSSRDVDWAPRWHRPLRPGLSGRRRAGARGRRSVHPDGAGRSPAGALLGGRPGLCTVGSGYYSRWNGSDMLSGMLIGGMLFGGMGNMFGGVGEGLGGLGEGIGEIGSGIGEGIGDIGGGIGDMFGDMFD